MRFWLDRNLKYLLAKFAVVLIKILAVDISVPIAIIGMGGP